jgi:hypothetical protein
MPVSGCRGFQVFWAIRSQMAVRLSAVGAGLPLLPIIFLLHISVRDCTTVRLQGLHTPWRLVRKRTINTERPPLVSE